MKIRKLTDDDIYATRILIDRVSLAIQALDKGRFERSNDKERMHLERLQNFVVNSLIEDLELRENAEEAELI